MKTVPKYRAALRKRHLHPAYGLLQNSLENAASSQLGELLRKVDFLWNYPGDAIQQLIIPAICAPERR